MGTVKLFECLVLAIRCYETHDYQCNSRLINFCLQSEYYNHYYIKGCGGAFGLPLDFHPWREIEGARRSKIGSVKVNVTFPRTITGHGGSSRLDLVYTCRRNFCSGNTQTLLRRFICRRLYHILILNRIVFHLQRVH